MTSYSLKSLTAHILSILLIKRLKHITGIGYQDQNLEFTFIQPLAHCGYIHTRARKQKRTKQSV